MDDSNPLLPVGLYQSQGLAALQLFQHLRRGIRGTTWRQEAGHVDEIVSGSNKRQLCPTIHAGLSQSDIGQ